ncbi:hypothetical protein M231_04342 [Tremella mesenterica]|uniref:RlpA-like protein double-psi beta-barrel domain-containing protein n=1 Tax=Tremella mesenterica TaxID=5217 RepID=A0A4Q1BKZ0_TREME|nr:hypothetical protein M231_04342 [Tremella mesenterica]
MTGLTLPPLTLFLFSLLLFLLVGPTLVIASPDPTSPNVKRERLVAQAPSNTEITPIETKNIERGITTLPVLPRNDHPTSPPRLPRQPNRLVPQPTKRAEALIENDSVERFIDDVKVERRDEIGIGKRDDACSIAININLSDKTAPAIDLPSCLDGLDLQLGINLDLTDDDGGDDDCELGGGNFLAHSETSSNTKPPASTSKSANPGKSTPGNGGNDSDNIVALSWHVFGGNGYDGPSCGKTLTIVTSKGKQATAVVADECASCPDMYHVDMSTGLFSALGLDKSTGEYVVKWQCPDCVFEEDPTIGGCKNNPGGQYC